MWSTRRQQTTTQFRHRQRGAETGEGPGGGGSGGQGSETVVRAGGLQPARHPAPVGAGQLRLLGHPVLHQVLRDEVAARPIGDADGVNDGQVTGAIQIPKRLCFRVQAEVNVRRQAVGKGHAGP